MHIGIMKQTNWPKESSVQPGLYGERKLLGAKVRIISSPAHIIFEEYDNERLYFIKKIEYRVSLDGKLGVSFLLDGLENTRFLPEELMIVELPVCGEINNEEDEEEEKSKHPGSHRSTRGEVSVGIREKHRH